MTVTDLRRQCLVCGYSLDATEVVTCLSCLGQARRDLIAIMDLYALLPTHALNAAQQGRLGAEAAIVLLGRGSEGLEDDGETNPSESLPPAYALGWWERRWRTELGLPAVPPPWQRRADRLLVQSYGFLSDNLGRLSERRGFDTFAADLIAVRRTLEGVLRAGDRPDRGVRCFECDTELVRDYHDPRPCTRPDHAAPVFEPLPDLVWLGPHGFAHVTTAADRRAHYAAHQTAVSDWYATHRCDQGGLHDPGQDAGWRCPRCRREYSAGEYRLALNASYDDHADFRSQPDATRLTGAPRGTIQMWATRGLIRKRRALGRTVTYSVTDIEARLAKREDDAG